jgi:hypothetical protein
MAVALPCMIHIVCNSLLSLFVSGSTTVTNMYSPMPTTLVFCITSPRPMRLIGHAFVVKDYSKCLMSGFIVCIGFQGQAIYDTLFALGNAGLGLPMVLLVQQL